MASRLPHRGRSGPAHIIVGLESGEERTLTHATAEAICKRLWEMTPPGSLTAAADLERALRSTRERAPRVKLGSRESAAFREAARLLGTS